MDEDELATHPTLQMAVASAPATAKSVQHTKTITISHAHLLVSKQGEDHAKRIIGPTNSRNDEAVKAMLHKLEAMKMNVRSWARMEIATMMLQEAEVRKLQLDGVAVHNFRQIKQYWASSDSPNAKVDMFSIAYGIWENKPGWDVQLEIAFMDENGWKYKMEEDTNQPQQKRKREEGYKGCVAWLISHVKGDMVKQIQECGLKGKYSRTIRISRYKEIVMAHKEESMKMYR